MDALERAVEIYGSRAALARAIGVTPEAVRQWKVKGTVPAARCGDIERVTDGAVTAAQLRPDLAGIFGARRPRNNVGDRCHRSERFALESAGFRTIRRSRRCPAFRRKTSQNKDQMAPRSSDAARIMRRHERVRVQQHRDNRQPTRR